jgi:hypothetical protein
MKVSHLSDVELMWRGHQLAVFQADGTPASTCGSPAIDCEEVLISAAGKSSVIR